MKKWYAVYTKNGLEKKVFNLLSKKKIKCYLPQCPLSKEWYEKKIMKCLFPSYVFVYITEDQIVQVKKTNGVINFIHWLNNPAVIKDMEIDMMKRFIMEHKYIQVEKKAVNINGMVKIIGTNTTVTQQIQKFNNLNYIKLFLPSLGYFLTAEAEPSNINRIKEHSTLEPDFISIKIKETILHY